MNGAAWLDLIPRYAFTPDGKAILIAWRGRIERRLLDGAPAAAIPFTARLQLAVGPSTRVAIEEPRGPVRAKLLQGTAASPDGARVAYAALGSLYVQGMDGSARSEEHTSELQSLMRISYAVFCLKKKTIVIKYKHQINRQHP